MPLDILPRKGYTYLMSNLIETTLKAAQLRGNRLAERSNELFDRIKPILKKGAITKEVAEALGFTRDYTGDLLEGMEDLGLVYKKRVVGKYMWFVDDEDGRDQMKLREEVLKEFKRLRTEQNKILNKFCKENGICDRCHNPNRQIVEKNN